ncbi:MAG: DNA-directed RNA polymerase subunit alpha [Candidatus Yonathbacteria bacterium CG10_big_fil_rev_8_21_14_0_10_43_136]|uniref:DNA-directed RNA polymerase subunit alpha n=2 Tax=Parcubacteria group TaxID=1794811 RepID=A0A2M7Q5L7_9BACT|nr:MAG: DNA-directed RNA polymerase subunit alpha [Candidatus Nomurabacteria bacterium CG2_30_43_9]PIQ35816.1 MAG: DNA-directed RNA polymerase subunit alpha [Candidatus Yonathbacteria bacterium CG17_big_fil_post_rev_8_21_14_2_50_43_9]PIR40692.1 MAG: DNA-directed RNA polymerase subunit alpha [Candidatus Yonathbacteria bacterium CG10_big_fil_rev_8_21_14_0_10_43_136]PIX57239.1 MAG: DNA-directed RNA polymerase subunit alpha [Candidatus Yonathbacteria bacterium CG_4_10_14_3_um_filter_43_12]PIY58365.
MLDYNITLPSKPKVLAEDGFKGSYEIEGLYPGYGHTLGNSLRRIILSSLLGAAITSVKIDGVSHEFSTIEGVKEDVITILLNLKKARFKLSTMESQTVTLSVKGSKDVTAGDIKLAGQVEVLNPEQHIATLTDKNASLNIEIVVAKGFGYVSKEVHQKGKVDIGTIALDAIFTPIRRVNYEVDNMRVGDRTDFNRLRITVETDGTITPRRALEASIEIMVNQLKSVIGFVEKAEVETEETLSKREEKAPRNDLADNDFLKTRVENLDFSTRTNNALSNANIRTIGGLTRKTEEDLLEIDGLGDKGIQEIKRALSAHDITLKV